MTIGLLLALAALALVDSTSFGTLIIPLYLVLALDRPRTWRLTVYLATVSAFYFLVGVALMLRVGVVMDAFGEVLQSRPAYIAQLVAGVALIVLSYRLDPKWRAKRGKPELKLQPRVGGPATMVMLGLTAAVLEVATMVPYLAAIGLMTTSGLVAAQWLPALAAYTLVMILPILVIIGLRAAAGERLEPRLERLRRWLSKHSASAASWAVAIVGILLIRDAVAYLFSQPT